MARINVFFAQANNRSEMVANAMFDGLTKCGEDVVMRKATSHHGRVEPGSIAVFYGLSGGLARIFKDYRERGKAFFIDLGYWKRHKRTRWDGYHKIVLNSRHPTEYFQMHPKPQNRLRALGIRLLPMRKSDLDAPIIVAGMSAKAAAAEGLRAESWERTTIERLRKITSRPIIYRPKPNWIGSRPITGSRYDKDTPLDHALRNCHAIVTHHSNVAVDGLIAGVPVFCEGGVPLALGKPMAQLEEIENPFLPTNAQRLQWACDLAFTQWSVEEMASGAAWQFLINEGLTR